MDGEFCTLHVVSYSVREVLFTGLDLPALGFSVTEHKATERATHFVLEKGWTEIHAFESITAESLCHGAIRTVARREEDPESFVHTRQTGTFRPLPTP